MLPHHTSLLLIVVGVLVLLILLGTRAFAHQLPSWEQISSTRLLDTIKVLSSDDYEGRAPATRGETLTTAYIEEQFKKVGLTPGNPDGTYVQQVPLVGIKPETNPALLFTGADGSEEKLIFGEDFVVWTKRVVPTINLEADLVFVGYGIVAPEYHWDDFKDVDVTGKIIVVLINDPPVPDPHDPTKLDETTFKGKAMTYYGRWTYKFEVAAARGAAGCLIVHETEPAGYGWDVVRTSFTGEQFSPVTDDHGMSRCAQEGWISYNTAKRLFALAGKDFDVAAKSAVSRNFRPVILPVKAQGSLSNSLRTIQSKNIVGRLAGSDPTVCDEFVIYMAHWDHVGIGPEINGDKIYHGAIDNASGVAGIIEVASGFMHVPTRPRRSILFIATTGEEQGLLGSQYYAEHPLIPLSRTLAAINIDGLNMWGRRKDVEVVGLGQSTLDEVIRAVATEQEKIVTPDSQPEKGSFFRGDHFSFAKKGVPSFHIQDIANTYIGRPEGWGAEINKKFLTEDYHRPSDTVKPDWDLTGAVEDLKLFAEIGYRVANGKTFPQWKANSEFSKIDRE